MAITGISNSHISGLMARYNPEGSRTGSAPSESKEIMNISHMIKPEASTNAEVQARLDRQDRLMRSEFTFLVASPPSPYAEIKVAGKTVATVFNDGTSEMTDEAGGRLSQLNDPGGLEGPALAQWRADKYAAVLGGKVLSSPTALTQQEWKALPPPTWIFDEQGFSDYRENLLNASQRLAQYQRSEDQILPIPGWADISV